MHSPLVIYLEEHKKISNLLPARLYIENSDQALMFDIPVLRVWEYTIDQLLEYEMYFIILLQFEENLRFSVPKSTSSSSFKRKYICYWGTEFTKEGSRAKPLAGIVTESQVLSFLYLSY